MQKNVGLRVAVSNVLWYFCIDLKALAVPNHIPNLYLQEEKFWQRNGRINDFAEEVQWNRWIYGEDTTKIRCFILFTVTVAKMVAVLMYLSNLSLRRLYSSEVGWRHSCCASKWMKLLGKWLVYIEPPFLDSSALVLVVLRTLSDRVI